VILVLGGPTAAGKTAAAMAVADAFGARLVSADAMQVYRRMDIGTGKPTPEELQRYPHACVDIREPTEEFSAADFARSAEACIAEGGPVCVVGGTSFYLRALLVGLAPTPPVDLALRAELEALADLHAELAAADPGLAAELHPNDRVRIVRALEVFRQTGRPFSQIRAEHRAAGPRQAAVRLWLDRDDLDARIDRRVGEMVSAGYVDEVAALLDEGVPRHAKPMKSLGYRHLAEHLLDGLPLDEAVRRTRRDTRKFARKQRTFLKGLGGFDPLPADDRDAVLRAAERAFSAR